MRLAQPFPDLPPVSLIVNVNHNQMIHADQTVKRRADLMTHIGKKLPLRSGPLRRNQRPDLIFHDDQQHNNHRHHT